MIDALLALIKTNPLLAGGIGTIAFGSVMYYVRSIPTWLYAGTKRMLTIHVALTSESFLYHELMAVLSIHRIGAFARSFTTDRDGEIVAGFGHSYGMFDGRRLPGLAGGKVDMQELVLFHGRFDLLEILNPEAILVEFDDVGLDPLGLVKDEPKRQGVDGEAGLLAKEM